MEEPQPCLDFRDDGSCRGAVEYHSTDPGVRPAFPRCERHWLLRWDNEEETRRRYPEHPPSDWSPLDAGESWYEDA